jgi:hypothetical protein
LDGFREVEESGVTSCGVDVFLGLIRWNATPAVAAGATEPE